MCLGVDDYTNRGETIYGASLALGTDPLGFYDTPSVTIYYKDVDGNIIDTITIGNPPDKGGRGTVCQN